MGVFVGETPGVRCANGDEGHPRVIVVLISLTYIAVDPDPAKVLLGMVSHSKQWVC